MRNNTSKGIVGNASGFCFIDTCSKVIFDHFVECFLGCSSYSCGTDFQGPHKPCSNPPTYYSYLKNSYCCQAFQIWFCLNLAPKVLVVERCKLCNKINIFFLPLE